MSWASRPSGSPRPGRESALPPWKKKKKKRRSTPSSLRGTRPTSRKPFPERPRAQPGSDAERRPRPDPRAPTRWPRARPRPAARARPPRPRRPRPGCPGPGPRGRSASIPPTPPMRWPERTRPAAPLIPSLGSGRPSGPGARIRSSIARRPLCDPGRPARTQRRSARTTSGRRLGPRSP